MFIVDMSAIINKCHTTVAFSQRMCIVKEIMSTDRPSYALTM